MRLVVFTHSLVSDWNHGNAHFLRGVLRELRRRGHSTTVYEPRDGWSRTNLLRDHGEVALRRFAQRFPELRSELYDRQDFDPERMLEHADVVLVHEWNDPWVIDALSRHRLQSGRYTLLFHDTHHRAVTAPHEICRFNLEGFNGVLCFGEVIRQLYLQRGWAARAWTWHEAADTALFHPLPDIARTEDLVWVGNWGDDERRAELREFLLAPIRELQLSALLHGVRYPADALGEIGAVGARYGGWLPNDAVPELFARFRLTVHVPRRPYTQALPGIPTIRVFEALACGIPLVCSPWEDSERLFREGDYLVAHNGAEMTTLIRQVLNEPSFGTGLAARGLETVRARHTCAHRVAELIGICENCRGVAFTEAEAGAM